MSKVQTRRAVSLSRQTWDSIKERAAELKISASEYVTRLVRADIPTLAPQIHTRALAAGEQRLVVHVPNATAEPPRPVLPSRLVLDDLANKRRLGNIKPGTLCAICVEYTATHGEQIDAGGPVYPVCDGCAAEHPRSGRYSFEGGKADMLLGAAGATRRVKPHRVSNK